MSRRNGDRSFRSGEARTAVQARLTAKGRNGDRSFRSGEVDEVVSFAAPEVGRNGDRSFRSGEDDRAAFHLDGVRAAMETAPFGAVKLRTS